MGIDMRGIPARNTDFKTKNKKTRQTSGETFSSVSPEHADFE
jgi:hypothetical protein